MKKQLLFIVFLIVGSCVLAMCSKRSACNQNLIPRKILFGNPVKARPRISPDGKQLAYLAPNRDNVLNVFVADLTDEGLKNDIQITYDDNRGVRTYFWAPNGSQILFLQDTDGDENWELYGINLSTNEKYDYTPFAGVQTSIMAVDKNHQDKILITMNKENPENTDVYSLTLSTGDLELVEKNPGSFISFLEDKDFNILGGVKSLDDGGRQFLIKDKNSSNSVWKPIITWGLDDSLSSPLEFADDSRYVYVQDSRDANTARLIKLDVQTGSFKVLLEDVKYDLASVFFDEDTRKPRAASIEKAQTEWSIFDVTFKQDFEIMSNLDEGEIKFLSTDDKSEKYIIGFIKDDGPATFYLYDAITKKGTYLFNHLPELEKYNLTPMKPISFNARDGLEIHGYLTLPVDKEPKGLPMVLDVHGGPWTRDSWGYNSEAQWLANRGYAVLQLNYRGSTGYGKKFLNAGNKEWGGKMLDDLIDGVNWAIDKGIADKDKVGIYGASYGGYAALAGATFTPDVFACAVDIVGPSSILTLIESIPPYWEVFKQDFYRRVGNYETEKEFLKSRSPLFFVENIKIPMLIAQGANDPRVKQAESEQIVAELKEKGIEHEYLLFKDEGHGFAKPENRFVFYRAAEKFLAQHLGGCYQR